MITRGSTLAPKQLNFFLTRNGARKQSFKVCIWAATERFSQNTIHNGISERRRVGSWQEKRLDKRRSYWQKKWLDTSYWYRLYRREISKLTQRQKRTKKSWIWRCLLVTTHTWNNSFARPIMGAFLRHGQVFKKWHALSDKSDSGMSIFKHNDDDCISDMSASESDRDEPTQHGGGIPWRSLIPWRQRRGKFLLLFFQLVDAWPSKRNGQVVSPSSLTIISLPLLHPCFPRQEINGWQPRLFFPTVPHHGTNHISSRLVSSRVVQIWARNSSWNDDLIVAGFGFRHLVSQEDTYRRRCQFWVQWWRCTLKKVTISSFNVAILSPYPDAPCLWMPSNQISLSVVLKKKGKYIAQVQSLSLVFAPFDEAEDAFWNAVWWKTSISNDEQRQSGISCRTPRDVMNAIHHHTEPGKVCGKQRALTIPLE